MPFSFRNLLFSILTALIASAFSPALAQQTVRLQLKWYHQFQFAGYYAAQKQGFYKQEGLNVIIKEGTPDRLPIKTVLNGDADYGVSGSDILSTYLQKKPVVVTAVIFQHSADIFLSLARTGIRSPNDLVGKTVMTSDEHGRILLQSVLLREGIPLNSIHFIAHSWQLNDLVKGKADALTAYSTVEPQKLQAKGYRVNMIRPIDYGIDFYGDLIFTTRSRITNNPKQVQAFTRASIRGWEYAMHHEKEIAKYILNLPGVKERGLTMASLLKEAGEMEKLILPDLIEVGHINKGRWHSMLAFYKDLGVADKDADIENLIYTQKSPRDNVFILLVIILIIATVISLGILFWNWQLQRQVDVKTTALRDENLQRFEAEQKLDLALEAGSLGTWQWDVPSGELIFNERWARMLGYQLKDIPTNNSEWISMVHPEDTALLNTTSEDLINGMTDSNSTAYRLKTNNGSWKWILSFRKAVNRNADGIAERITGVHVDIDSIKNRENELNEISKELVKKNKELEKFAYITSHNLRAPVVNLKSLTDIYIEGGMDEKSASDIFSKIRQSVNRLDTTLNDLIQIVSNKGGEAINLEAMNFEQELTYIMASIEKQIIESGAQINYDFSEAETVFFSKRYLHSTLINLLTNAIKYRSYSRPLVINIKSYHHKDFVYFIFTDNGIGIDMERFKNKIFGLYQRLTQEREGKGLGLYIIKSQIEALDGKIEVESKLDKGTTFKVLFYNPHTRDAITL